MADVFLPLYRVNAFTDQLFAGNPATVIFLKRQFTTLDFYTLLAGEMATPETAFIQPLDFESPKKAQTFWLRWFMPTQEVKMCGHATQAAAFLLFHNYRNPNKTLIFKTLSGDILAHYDKKTKEISLDFPVDTFADAQPSPALLTKLGLSAYTQAVYSAERNLLIIEVDKLQTLLAVQPDFEALRQHQEQAIKKVALTVAPLQVPVLLANGIPSHTDFVSRCFCPWIGIEEDALSAASHTLLAKYWAEKLQKNTLTAFQASSRTGVIRIVLKDNQRATLIGTAKVVMQGEVILR